MVRERGKGGGDGRGVLSRWEEGLTSIRGTCSAVNALATSHSVLGLN